MTTQFPTHRMAILDNWMLQLACEILEFGIVGESSDFRIRALNGYDTLVYDEFVSRQDAPITWGWFTRDHIGAMLNFLDAAVLYDRIGHDQVRSFVWDQSTAFGAFFNILTPVAVPDELPIAFAEFTHAHDQLNRPTGQKSPMLFTASIPRGRERHVGGSDPYWEEPGREEIEERALFYVGLAARVHGTYWPAPARADYLEHYVLEDTKVTSDVRTQLQASLQAAALDMANRTFDNKHHPLVQIPPLRFPGFGSAVLSYCESPASILSTVLEVRGSEPAAAFRAWLAEYELAIRSANLLRAARLVKEVRHILSDLERNLGLRQDPSNQLQVQVGATPSVTFPSGEIGAFFRKILPQPLHLVFIRGYLNRAFAAADLDREIRRLFPLIPLQVGRR